MLDLHFWTTRIILLFQKGYNNKYKLRPDTNALCPKIVERIIRGNEDPYKRQAIAIN